jgi:hypothetical protein
VVDLLNANFITQLLHSFAGAAVTALLFIKLGFPDSYYAIGIFLLVILGKETLFDPRFEKNQPFLWEGAQDFLFYLPGIAAALLIIRL